MEKVAFIIDGGFFTKQYKHKYKIPPTADEVEHYIQGIFSYLQESVTYPIEIYRIFYYDCPPIRNLKSVTKKHSKMNSNDFEKICKIFQKNYNNIRSFHDKIKIKNYFALRIGELRFQGWEEPINSSRLKYWRPKLRQKGVDMRMGLDIASITAKKLCTKLVLISGDTDMIPAMKTARKEGIQVYWSDMWVKEQGAKVNFLVHSDFVIGDVFHKNYAPSYILKSSNPK